MGEVCPRLPVSATQARRRSLPMLVLSRKESQRIRVGDDIEIVVCQVGRNQVRLGISAPPKIAIVREELLDTKENATFMERRPRRPLSSRCPHG
jgi:carbon storage regulator CsrA